MRNHSFGLDAVRCVAILLVLACHCGASFASWMLLERPAFLQPLGYFGVEIFFVLSGFLIGGILLDLVARGAGVRDWIVFMARRWIRTLPLYFLWLGILGATWPPGLMHTEWAAIPRLVPAFATFTQNLAWAPPDWFTVSWSLSIEEWFYLLFSASMLVASRLLGGRTGPVVVLAAFLAVPLGLRLAEPAGVDWNEFLHKAVVFRLDAIAFGVAAVALVRAGLLRGRARKGLLATGAVMLALQILVPASAGFLGIRAARALGFDATDLAVALMLPALSGVAPPRAWVEAPVRHFAAQSYGTYVMHYTLLDWVGFARITTHWSGVWSSLLSTGLILVLPAISWHAFERPLLRLRPASRVRPDPA